MALLISGGTHTLTFLGLLQSSREDADVIVLPLPFEGTVSYGSGTAAGPEAVLAASQQVELWDDEIEFDLESLAIHTAEPVWPAPGESTADYLIRVEGAAATTRAVALGIGGEHSVTPPLVRAACGGDDLRGLTVVQIDAHTDLRSDYEGDPHSHACAMRRLTDAGAALVAIGIRASSREEAEYAASRDNIEVYRAQLLASEPEIWSALVERLRGLAGDVYFTIDIDGLSTTLCPGTGTPEPGGLDWWPVLEIARAVLLDAIDARIVGCDIVETVPMQGTHVNEFATARLAGKLVAYLGERRNRES